MQGLPLLYAYITHPIRTLTLNKTVQLGWIPFIALLLSSLANLIPGASLFDFSIIGTTLGMSFTIAGILIFQAMTIDFMAQIFKLPAQSYRLFLWLCMSTLPNCLLTPLFLISQPFGYRQSTLYTLFTTAIILVNLYLEFVTIQHLYETSKTKAFMLLFFPFILIFALIWIAIVFWVLAILPGSFYTSWL